MMFDWNKILFWNDILWTIIINNHEIPDIHNYNKFLA